MHELYELKDKLCEELKEYKNKELNKANLEVVEKLSETIKNLGKIIENYGEEEEYSSMNRNSYRGRSYDSYGGRSYDERRNRDSRGRYSTGGMVDELRQMMNNAPDERTRQEFHKFISKMEQL